LGEHYTNPAEIQKPGADRLFSSGESLYPATTFPGGIDMKPKAILAIAASTLAGGIAILASVSGGAAQSPTPIYLDKIPEGYRDWRVISVAHEEGSLHSFAVVLGNDIAIKAYRDKKLPFPDGAIIAALHYSHTPSKENNAVFGQEQSFVPGAPTNIQFEVKDSKKYAATAGWGFGHFGADGKPGSEAFMKTCAPCHAKASTDAVFTHYAP
jgi:hypothetical protein